MKKARKALSGMLALLFVLFSLPAGAMAAGEDADAAPRVAKVEVQDLTLIQGTNGYNTQEYDEQTGDYISYYRYQYTPEFVVTFEDGSVLKGRDGVNYNDNWYNLLTNDDQSAANAWGIGRHTVTASLFDVETTFTVEIVESPYVSVEVLEVEPVQENRNCFASEEGALIYSLPHFYFKVTREDGSCFTRYSRYDDVVSVTSNQETSPWTPGGDNRILVHYLNVTAQASVEMQPAPAFEYVEQDGGLFITGYGISSQQTLEIPSQIDGKPVTGLLSLGTTASSLEHISIPDSVTTISKDFFTDAYSLKTVAVGSGVKHLNLDMFRYCRELTAIEITADNSYYADVDGVVYNKQQDTLVVYPLGKGTSYTVPAGVANIDVLGDMVYQEFSVSFAPDSKLFVTEDGVTYNADKTKVIFCAKDKSGHYDMPDTVKQIVESAFDGCSQLTGVSVSDNVTSLVYRTFADCTSLASISLPQNLQSIDAQAFSNCSKLNEIELPNSLKKIGESAFQESGLSTLSIPNSVEEIDEYAFDLCVNLTDVTLPDGLTSLSGGIFQDCKSLTDITVPNSVTSIGTAAFSGCSRLQNMVIPNSVTSIESSAFSSCSDLSEIVIPDSVTQLGEWAFSSCTRLQNVTLGKGLTAIPGGAFSSCGFKTLRIPAHIQEIGDSAFSSCDNLIEVVFENKNITMGNSAFYGCPLKEVNLPEGVTNTGGEFTFSGSAITSLSLPDSVTTITYGAFARCSQLSKIDIPSSVVSMQGHAFDRTPWYEAQPEGPVYLEHVFYGYKGDVLKSPELKLQEGTTVVADFALEHRNTLTTLTLPEGLKTIGAYSLFDCETLTELSIPASVTYIDTSAFVGCSALNAIQVAPGNPNYKSINGVLFSGDGSVLLWCPKQENTKYEVPDGVSRIATGAFSESGIDTLKITDPDIEFDEYSVGYHSTGRYDIEREFYSDDFGYDGSYFTYQHVEIICPADSAAYRYAKQNHLLVTVPEEVVLESEEDSIHISTTDDVVSPGTELKVQPKDVDSLTVVGAENYKLDTAVVFDISLENDGQKIQPNGSVTVSMPVPQTLNGKKCRVLYVDLDGHITDMKAYFENGRMVFKTNHFSHYMIVEVNVLLGDLNNDGDIAAADALLALQAATDKITLNDDPMKAADVDGKTGITANDALLILQRATQKISGFPAEDM